VAEPAPARELRAPAALLIAPIDDEVGVALRRYAVDSYPAELGPVAAGAGVVLDLPADKSPRPWQLGLSGSGAVRLCPLARP
jgi:hypothetical protein